MAFQCRFIRGNYQTIEHTPETAVAAGAIVVINDMACIAHHDIPAGTLGALAVDGGEYEVDKDGSSSGPEFSVGEKFYWDDSGDEAVESATSNAKLGYVSRAAVATDTSVRFIHHTFD